MLKSVNELLPKNGVDETIEKVALLTSGTELLMGQIINTNAAYLAGELNKLGLTCQYQLVVGDNEERLLDALNKLWKVADCVILTGGLGPTEDDLSMACAAKNSGFKLTFDPEAAATIEAYFKRSGRDVPQNNYKQAYLPGVEAGFALPNLNGTAPGAIWRFVHDNKLCHLILLPGPPLENKLMFTEYVKPYLAARCSTILRNLFFRMVGIGESQVAAELEDLITTQTNPTLATYCSVGEVKLRLTQNCHSDSDPELIPALADVVRSRLGKYIYSEKDESLPEVIYNILKHRGESLGLAESCTAGAVAAELGNIPGVSHVFKGSLVAYSPEIKKNVLGVPKDIIDRDGVVSAACAASMAEHAQKLLNVSIAGAVTGLAGPMGSAVQDSTNVAALGKAEPPIGTVFVAVTYRGRTVVKHNLFSGSRAKVIAWAKMTLLGLIWHCLNDEA